MWLFVVGILLFVGIVWWGYGGRLFSFVTVVTTTTLDENDQPTGSTHTFPVPKPDRKAQNGLSYVGAYVSRMAASDAPRCSLIISASRRRGGVLLQYFNPIWRFSLNVHWRKHPEKEKAIRAFFQSRNIPAFQDYLSMNGGVADSTRILYYELEGEAQHIADLCTHYLQEVCHVQAHEALEFSYQAYDD